jgi:hypothetical protein
MNFTWKINLTRERNENIEKENKITHKNNAWLYQK